MPTQPYVNSAGVTVPGVTTVLSSNLGWDSHILLAWARKTALAGTDPDVIKEQAASTGTLAHYIIECYVNNHPLDINNSYSPEQKQQAANCARGFKAWEQKYKPTFVGSEISIVHEDYNYGGTIDIVSKIDNKLVINDLKTNNFVNAKMLIQVSAYKKLYEYLTKETVDHCEIIQLNKDKPEFKLYQFHNELLDYGWQAFEMLLKLHELKRKLKITQTDKGTL